MHHVVAAHNTYASMSRRANYWDNAVAESFFSSLKKNVSSVEFTQLVKKHAVTFLITSRCFIIVVEGIAI